jgi:hypothetical protein
LNKYQISRPLCSQCWKKWTAWLDIPKLNNYTSVCKMMVFMPSTSPNWALEDGYLCGIKTIMTNVCFLMGSLDLA